MELCCLCVSYTGGSLRFHAIFCRGGKDGRAIRRLGGAGERVACEGSRIIEFAECEEAHEVGEVVHLSVEAQGERAGASGRFGAKGPAKGGFEVPQGVEGGGRSCQFCREVEEGRAGGRRASELGLVDQEV